MDIQTRYQDALKFASAKHTEILVAAPNSPGFNTAFAVQVALLHDTIEDTATDFKELENLFGTEIAKAVSALSKNELLPKEQQMQDCLNRIKELPREVWAVKLADRITNLQPPPSHWNNEKKIKYHKEAQTILDALGKENDYLASRLAAKIKDYEAYLNS
jgi:guanosine-3',5'-bis(diphosphate) 3'-pyrophosphohydrolase